MVSSFTADEDGAMWFVPGEDVETGTGGAEWWEPEVVDGEEHFLPIAEGFTYDTDKAGDMVLTWSSGLQEELVPLEIAASRVVMESTTGSGALVVDLSDPTRPTVVSSLGRGDAHGVAALGGEAWVDHNGQATAYDLTDPARPVLAGEVDSRGSAVLLSDAVVVTDTGAWDVRDPAAPVLVAELHGSDDWSHLARGGDLLVQTGSTGLQVVQGIPWEGAVE